MLLPSSEELFTNDIYYLMLRVTNDIIWEMIEKITRISLSIIAFRHQANFHVARPADTSSFHHCSYANNFLRREPQRKRRLQTSNDSEEVFFFHINDEVMAQGHIALP